MDRPLPSLYEMEARVLDHHKGQKSSSEGPDMNVAGEAIPSHSILSDIHSVVLAWQWRDTAYVPLC